MPSPVESRGTITEMSDGRFRVRAPNAYNRASWGIYATREEAQRGLESKLQSLAAPGAFRDVGLSFAAFGARVLDQREHDGVRGIEQERRNWRLHLEGCALADRHVADIRPADVAALTRTLARKKAQDKRGERKLDKGTVRKIVSLASSVFDEAVVQEVRPDNPCAGVKLKNLLKAHDAGDGDTEEVWDYLRLDEQEKLWACEAIPLADRCLLAFAWGTGLRQGEQWNLPLADLHTEGADPYVFVRVGSKGKRPKSGKTRRVPLFGIALEAARTWLELLPKWAKENPHRLAFPTVTGCRRQPGAPERSVRRPGEKRGAVHKVELLDAWLDMAGVKRRIRWHDLRHTCASSLVSGFWGRAWTLEEVKEMLGHSSISVTQKYAHLGDTVLKTAAKETRPTAAVPPVQDAQLAALLALMGPDGIDRLRGLLLGQKLVTGPAGPGT